MTNRTLIGERAKKVFDLIRADLEAGLYEHVPGSATELGSWSDLYDFVDANGYLDQVLGWDATNEDYDEVSYVIDVLLSENPIPLV
jgi:hypothetical protein